MNDSIYAPLSSTHQVFVSYSRAEWRQVQRLVREIRNCGVDTWVDIENLKAGDHWKFAIREALGHSNALVFCVSPLSVESGWTCHELTLAVELGLNIIPVIIDPVNIEDLPPPLGDYQAINITNHPIRFAAHEAALEICTAIGFQPTQIDKRKELLEHLNDAVVLYPFQTNRLLSDEILNQNCPIEINHTRPMIIERISASDFDDVDFAMSTAKWMFLIVTQYSCRYTLSSLVGFSIANNWSSRLSIIVCGQIDPHLKEILALARARVFGLPSEITVDDGHGIEIGAQH